MGQRELREVEVPHKWGQDRGRPSFEGGKSSKQCGIPHSEIRQSRRDEGWRSYRKHSVADPVDVYTMAGQVRNVVSDNELWVGDKNPVNAPRPIAVYAGAYSHGRRFPAADVPSISPAAANWFHLRSAHFHFKKIRFRDAKRSSAAGTLRLNGWTLYRPIRTEHATVAWSRAQQRLATLAFIEVLTGIYRHGFMFEKTTARTGQHRFKQHGGRGHGFELRGVAGKPASAVALTNTAGLAFSGSNLTVALLWL